MEKYILTILFNRQWRTRARVLLRRIHNGIYIPLPYIWVQYYSLLYKLLEILGAIPSKLILSEAFDKNEVFERALNVYICEKEIVRLIALSSMRSL